MLDGGGGRDFFEYRGMDAPSAPTGLYDPDADTARDSKPVLTLGTGVFLEVGPEHAASPLVLDVPENLLRFDT